MFGLVMKKKYDDLHNKYCSKIEEIMNEIKKHQLTINKCQNLITRLEKEIDTNYELRKEIIKLKEQVNSTK